MHLTCAECGNPFTRTRSEVKAMSFCSKRCAYASKELRARIMTAKAQSLAEGRWVAVGSKGCKWSEEARQRASVARKGRVPPNKGKSMSLAQRKLLSEKGRGHPSWNKGLIGYNKGYPRNAAWIDNTRKSMAARWADPEYAQRWLKAWQGRPTLPETRLTELLDNISQGHWRYTGDGKAVVSGLMPDFMHSARPLIIELFGDYWHGPNSPWKARWRNTEEGRREAYSHIGYRLLVIWERELKDTTALIAKIKAFEEER